MRWRAKGDEDPIRWSIASHQVTALEIGNEIQSMSKLIVLTRFLLFRFRPGTMLVVISRPRSDSQSATIQNEGKVASCYLDFRRDISVEDASMDRIILGRSDTPHTDPPPMIHNNRRFRSRSSPYTKHTHTPITQIHTTDCNQSIKKYPQPTPPILIYCAFNARHLHCRTDTDTDCDCDWLSFQSESTSTSTSMFRIHFISNSHREWQYQNHSISCHFIK